MPPRASRPPALCHGPFLGSSAIASGLLTRAQLRSTAWHRILQDVYVDSRTPVDHRLVVQGAALLLPADAVVVGRSAAHLYGAGLATPDDPVTVAAPARWRAARGIHVSQRRLRSQDVRSFAGLRVTTPLATTYELASQPVLPDAVVWLDALGRARNLSRAQMREHCALHRGRQGWRHAARAIDLCDPRSESPAESRVRLHLALAGLPTPIPQFTVLHEGSFVARVDLAWPAWRFALEYDGQWHADPGQLGRDRRRIRTLNALGWYVYPVTSADLHHLDALARRVGELLALRRQGHLA